MTHAPNPLRRIKADAEGVEEILASARDMAERLYLDTPDEVVEHLASLTDAACGLAKALQRWAAKADQQQQ
jgi:hypothetical protein